MRSLIAQARQLSQSAQNRVLLQASPRLRASVRSRSACGGGRGTSGWAVASVQSGTLG